MTNIPDILWHITLVNSAAATGGAVLVWIAARCGLRPSWLHALWLAVLLRLVMPPLWPVAVLPADGENGPPSSVADMASAWGEASGQPVIALEIQGTSVSSATPGERNLVEAKETPPTMFSLAWRQRLWREITAWPWAAIALTAWAAGTVAWWSVAWSRLRRFHRLVKRGERMASPLCVAAGVPLRLIDARISPCLWAFGGRAFIAFPRALHRTLSVGERELILRHELAHYHRRDHWVRWVEFVVLGLQWWNPLAWWIVCRLRETEEAACDARVATGAPDSRRAYATALVRTADFLGADDAWSAPRLASGAGSLAPLKRRLHAIMENTPPPRRTGWAILLLAAASVVLVATPVAEPAGNQESAKTPPEASSPVAPSADAQPPPPNPEAAPTEKPADAKDISESASLAEAEKRLLALKKLTIRGEETKYSSEQKKIAYSGGILVEFEGMKIWADSGQFFILSDDTKDFRFELKGPNLLFTYRDKGRELILTCDTLVYDSAQDLVQANGQMETAVPIWTKGESLEFSPATGEMTGKFIASAVSEPEQNEIRLRLLSIKDKYPKLQSESSADSGIAENESGEKEVQVAYLKAYKQVMDAEKLEENKSLEQAIKLHQQALAAFEAIAQQWPDWQTGMVKGRVGLEKNRIARLQATHGPDDGRKSAQENEAIEGKPEKTDEPRHFPSSDETKAAQQVVKNFFAANTVDERLKYVRFGEAMRSRMEDWHQKHPLKTEELESSDLADSLTKILLPEGMQIIVVTLTAKGEHSETYRFFAVEKGPDGLKLDWETATGWQPMALTDFQQGETQAPQPFRVHAGKGDYYNGPFSDDSEWQCVELTYPGDAGFKVYGYVRRNSETGRHLLQLINSQSISCILELSRPASARKNQALIERLTHDSWFLKDAPLPVKE